MKHLLSLTLVAALGFAVVGCNKTEKVNASATASQCDGSDCDPANCDPSNCEGMKAGCDKMGTDACPMGKADVKPAAASANGCDPANCEMEDCNPAECGSANVKPAAAAAASTCDKSGNGSCHKSGADKEAAPADCPMHQE